LVLELVPSQSGDTMVVEMDVEAVRAQFNGNPMVGGHPPLVWDNPLLPEESYLVADLGVQLRSLGLLPGGGVQLEVASSNPGESYVVAREEAGGPILHHAIIHGLRVHSNETTAVDVLATYADGSRLIGTPIMLSRVTPDTRVEVEIFVRGVTFEDGTTIKTFTAADFDEYGRIYVKFILPAGVTSSYCHRIHVYEGEQYLGRY